MREFIFRMNLQCVCVNLTLHHQLQLEGFRFVLRLLIHQAGDILSVFSSCRDHPILALHGHCAVHLGHWSVIIAASSCCNPGDCCLWFPLGCLTSCHDNLRRAGLHWDGGSWVFGFSWWREKKRFKNEVTSYNMNLVFNSLFLLIKWRLSWTTKNAAKQHSTQTCHWLLLMG